MDLQGENVKLLHYDHNLQGYYKELLIRNCTGVDIYLVDRFAEAVIIPSEINNNPINPEVVIMARSGSGKDRRESASSQERALPGIRYSIPLFSVDNEPVYVPEIDATLATENNWQHVVPGRIVPAYSNMLVDIKAEIVSHALSAMATFVINDPTGAITELYVHLAGHMIRVTPTHHPDKSAYFQICFGGGGNPSKILTYELKDVITDCGFFRLENGTYLHVGESKRQVEAGIRKLQQQATVYTLEKELEETRKAHSAELVQLQKQNAANLQTQKVKQQELEASLVATKTDLVVAQEQLARWEATAKMRQLNSQDDQMDLRYATLKTQYDKVKLAERSENLKLLMNVLKVAAVVVPPVLTFVIGNKMKK